MRGWGSSRASGGAWGAASPHGVLEDESLGEGIKEGIRTWSHHLRPLVPLPSPEERSVVKHVLRQGVQGPEVPFAGVARLPGDLDEAVIET